MNWLSPPTTSGGCEARGLTAACDRVPRGQRHERVIRGPQ